MGKASARQNDPELRLFHGGFQTLIAFRMHESIQLDAHCNALKGQD